MSTKKDKIVEKKVITETPIENEEKNTVTPNIEEKVNVIPNIEETLVTKEIRLDEKVVVRSIAPWQTGCTRKLTLGDISVPPNGSIRLSREEIITQAQSGNRLLIGTDGYGKHATWYVEDEYVRKELEFDTDDRKQKLVNKEFVKELFNIKSKKDFEDMVINEIVTRAEKVALMENIKLLKINDYEKISFCMEHTEIKI